MRLFLLCLVMIPLLSAETDKTLSIYGCSPIISNGFVNSDYVKVCKIYDPETRRRFMLGIVDDGRGGGITIVPIDNEEKPR